MLIYERIISENLTAILHVPPDIIILYPQASGDLTTGVGCWNWDAYNDDPLFDTKQGVQLATVNAMAIQIRRVLEQAKVLPWSSDGPPTTYHMARSPT